MRFAFVLCAALLFACNPNETVPQTDAADSSVQEDAPGSTDTGAGVVDATEPVEDTKEPEDDTTGQAPCADVTCGDNASCADGTCYCDAGFTENPDGECVATDP